MPLHVQINCFRTIIATTPEDLLPTVYLCTNQVAPSHEGIELGIGDATLVKVCLDMPDCLKLTEMLCQSALLLMLCGHTVCDHLHQNIAAREFYGMQTSA